MKKVIIFILLFVSVSVSAQNIAVTDSVARKEFEKNLFSATPKGEPIGEKTEMIIGKQGGTLVSFDGKIEIVIPLDALQKNTTISIQPVTPTAQEAIGNGYDFEPSGTQFKKEVTLIYHYTEEDAEEGSPELMGIALQNNEGYWNQVNDVITDSIAKTITGKILHFSRYNPAWKIQFIIFSRRLKVNKKSLVGLVASGDHRLNDYLLANQFYFGPNTSTTFYVNGVNHGNSIEGFMSSEIRGQEIFQAPQIVPNRNPVVVMVEIHDRSGHITYKKSKVLVYDHAYEVTMESMQQGPTYSYLDKGSFVVSLEGVNARIIETVNENSTDKLEFACNCTYRLINRGANYGHIHITGVKSIKVTPPAFPNPPEVEIEFIEAPMRYSTLEITFIDKHGKRFTSTTERASNIVAKSNALPDFIKFSAQEGEHLIYKRSTPGGYYKETVRKLEDDE